MLENTIYTEYLLLEHTYKHVPCQLTARHKMHFADVEEVTNSFIALEISYQC